VAYGKEAGIHGDDGGDDGASRLVPPMGQVPPPIQARLLEAQVKEGGPRAHWHSQSQPLSFSYPHWIAQRMVQTWQAPWIAAGGGLTFSWLHKERPGIRTPQACTRRAESELFWSQLQSYATPLAFSFCLPKVACPHGPGVFFFYRDNHPNFPFPRSLTKNDWNGSSSATPLKSLPFFLTE